MKNKVIIIVLCLAFIAIYANANCTLTIPHVQGTKGSSIQLPIEINNDCEVVAFQLTFTVPDGVSINIRQSANSSRMSDHTVTMSHVEGNQYMLTCMSPTNTPLTGNSGEVLSIQSYIGNNLAEGDYSISIDYAVLSSRTGENVLNDANAQGLTVFKKLEKDANGYYLLSMPEDWRLFAAIAEITPTANARMTSDIDLGDDQTMIGNSVHYQGRFDGQGHTLTVDLKASDGVAPFRYVEGATIENLRIKGKIEATRHGVGGLVYKVAGKNVVTVIRSCQSSSLLLSGTSGNVQNTIGGFVAGNSGILFIEDCLFDGEFGDKNKLFNGGFVANTDYQLIIRNSLNVGSYPEQVSGYSGTFHRVDNGAYAGKVTLENVYYKNPCGKPQGTAVTEEMIVNGTVADKLQSDRIIERWHQGEMGPELTFSRYPEHSQLTIKPSKTVITEGDTFQLSVTTSEPVEHPLSVSLTAEHPMRFTLPATMIIPAGQASATVDVTATDDDVPSLKLPAQFVAYAEGYERAETLVMLHDNDLPLLELELTPDIVKEDDGPVSVGATLRRTTATATRITVRLSDDSEGGLYLPTRTLTLEKGQSEAYFNLGPVANSLVEGDRDYTVTAAVYIASCSCSVQGQTAGSVSAKLKVIDDDGPSLALTTGTTVLREGGTVQLTLRRNTDATRPLTLQLSSNHDDLLQYDHGLTMAAGQKEATVTVKALPNTTTGDSQTIQFSAQADGHSTGTCWLMLTDQTLPDGTIQLTSNKREAEVGQTIDLTVTVGNQGFAPLPANTRVYLRFSASSQSIPLRLEKDVMPGESAVITHTYLLTSATGQYHFEAKINSPKEIDELSTANNTALAELTVLPSFTAMAHTDKATYTQQDTVNISGTATGSGGTDADVEVYIISSNGRRQKLIAHTDGQGRFSTQWKPQQRQAGHFAVGACYPGSGATETQSSFEVFGIVADGSYATCEVKQREDYKGTITLTNPCQQQQTGLTIEALEQPNGVQFSFDVPKSLGGNEKTEAHFTIIGEAPSVGGQWLKMPIAISSAEGARTEYTIYYYVYAQKADLGTNHPYLATTMTLGTARDYPIMIHNTGLGASGPITMDLPPCVESATSNPLPSIAGGDSTAVMLRFLPTAEMKLNIPVTGRIGFNCEGGDGTAIDFRLTPVSDKTGTVTFDVVDEYTFNTSKKPHVAGATVKLRNPATNGIVAEGKTGANGTFTAEVPEGYYEVSVEAPKHLSYTGMLMIDPGQNSEEVFLPYTAVSMSWDVKESNVEDHYEIETVAKFETEVPKPVVTISLPDRDPRNDENGNPIPGGSIVPVTVTNHGLVGCKDLDIVVGVNSGSDTSSGECFKLVPLMSVHLDTLAAQTSQVFYFDLQYGASCQTGCMMLWSKEEHTNLCDKYGNREQITVQHYYGPCQSAIYESGGGVGVVGEDSGTTWTAASSGIGPGTPGGGGTSGQGYGGGVNYGSVTSATKFCDSSENASPADQDSDWNPCKADMPERLGQLALCTAGFSNLLESSMTVIDFGVDLASKEILRDRFKKAWAATTCINGLVDAFTAETVNDRNKIHGFGVLQSVVSCIPDELSTVVKPAKLLLKGASCGIDLLEKLEECGNCEAIRGLNFIECSLPEYLDLGCLTKKVEAIRQAGTEDVRKMLAAYIDLNSCLPNLYSTIKTSMQQVACVRDYKDSKCEEAAARALNRGTGYDEMLQNVEDACHYLTMLLGQMDDDTMIAMNDTDWTDLLFYIDKHTAADGMVKDDEVEATFGTDEKAAIVKRFILRYNNTLQGQTDFAFDTEAIADYTTKWLNAQTYSKNLGFEDYQDMLQQVRADLELAARDNQQPLQEYAVTMKPVVEKFFGAQNAIGEMVQELCGDGEWMETDMASIFSYFALIQQYMDDEGYIEGTPQELVAQRPANISESQAVALIERLRNTVMRERGREYDAGNVVDFAIMDSRLQYIAEVNKYARTFGYVDITDMYAGRLAKALKEAQQEMKRTEKHQTTGICSTVVLAFNQRMVLSRQAFLGTLTINNGHQAEPMRQLKLNLEVRNADDGKIATAHEMQINVENVEGAEGERVLGSNWTLAPKGTGVISIRFIPTSFAAPTRPTPYSFGGTVSYMDPDTQLTVTRQLNPVTLTVLPSPQLELDYFLQRDVYGDDPLTTDIVEPSVSAEFALLINNKGAGEAQSVTMATQQPQIVDNEKRLAVNFQIVSSSLDGRVVSPVLTNGSIITDFGIIAAGHQSYAQWWLTSTLLGHFKEYDVNVNHVTSYGNPDLSLVDTARIHELIHTLNIPGTDKPGWLVNDIEDYQDMPDMLYLADGTKAAVSLAAATVDKTNDIVYTMTVTPGNELWNYGSVTDPTAGQKLLSSITRQSDGVELSLQNFWQTDRTLRDGNDPLYEFRLHFADKIERETETYTLTFVDRPANVTMILDEDDTTQPASSNGIVNVNVKRTIMGNEWSTICLPFAMNEQQVIHAFGEETQLCDFNGYEVLDNGNTINVNFITVNAIEANHPYIIKVKETINDFSVNDVVVMSHGQPVKNLGTEDNPIAMVGNYINGTILERGTLFLYGGKFYYSVGKTKMQGFRAFFNFDDMLTDFNANARIIMMIDGVNTAIDKTVQEGITISEESNDTYNLGGQRVAKPGKGVYIVNGKKVIIL